MGDILSFKLQFVFEEGDTKKAAELHKLLKKYGVVKITHPINSNRVKHENRLQSILKCMVLGEEYTSGGLWRKYGKYTNLGPKSFQRDLNMLILQGLVIAKKSRHPSGAGRTMLLSKRNIYEDKYPGGEQ